MAKVVSINKILEPPICVIFINFIKFTAFAPIRMSGTPFSDKNRYFRNCLTKIFRFHATGTITIFYIKGFGAVACSIKMERVCNIFEFISIVINNLIIRSNMCMLAKKRSTKDNEIFCTGIAYFFCYGCQVRFNSFPGFPCFVFTPISSATIVSDWLVIRLKDYIGCLFVSSCLVLEKINTLLRILMSIMGMPVYNNVNTFGDSSINNSFYAIPAIGVSIVSNSYNSTFPVVNQRINGFCIIILVSWPIGSTPEKAHSFKLNNISFFI